MKKPTDVAARSKRAARASRHEDAGEVDAKLAFTALILVVIAALVVPIIGSLVATEIDKAALDANNRSNRRNLSEGAEAVGDTIPLFLALLVLAMAGVAVLALIRQVGGG